MFRLPEFSSAFWRSTLLTAAALTLTACAAVGNVSPSSEEKIVLQIDAGAADFSPGSIDPNTGLPRSEFQKVADEYTEMHPNVTIEFVDSGQRDGLVAQFAGGTEPDIANAFYMQASDHDVDWWVNIDTYLDQPNPYVEGNERWRDIFYENSLADLRQVDGSFYSVGVITAVFAIYYNQDILDAEGLTVPETWEEMIATQAALKAAGYTPMAIFTEHVQVQIQGIILSMLYDDIKEQIDTDGNGKFSTAEIVAAIENERYFTAEDPRYVEVWRLINDWSEYWTAEGVSAWDPSVVYNGFRDGETAMVMDIQRFGYNLDTSPEYTMNWGIMTLPKLTPESSEFATGVDARVVKAGIPQWGITKRAADEGKVEAAVDFLMYITSPAIAGRLLGEVGGWAPMVQNVEVPGWLDPFLPLLERQTHLGVPNQFLTGQYGETLSRRMQEMLFGDLPLDEFMAYITEAADEAIQELSR